MVDLSGKSFYIKELENIGRYIKKKAEDILLDFNISRIQEINFIFNIKIGELSTIDINKKYLPIIINEKEIKYQSQQNLLAKSYYIEELKRIGKNIEKKAEDILLDYDTNRTREINITFNIKVDEHTTIKVNKEYLPIIIDEEESKCQLQEK